MTPHRSHGAGSFVIDRRFRPAGRILRASGTTDVRTFNAINVALTEVARLGRLDLLRALRDGLLHPLELYDAFRSSRLDRLPTVEDLRPLEAAVDDWLPKAEIREITRRDYAQRLRRLLARRPDARLLDLPDLLRVEREACQRADQRTTFNRIRAACQAFLRDVLGQTHWLYGQIRAVRKLTETPRRSHPLTVEGVRALATELPSHAPALWALCLTGMRRSEYWGRWEAIDDRVLVHGTKTAGAERFVPLVFPIARAPTMYWGFAQALRKATDGFTRVHDLRKTFSNWCESAGIARTRRRLYLGHGRRDITDLYEEHDVRAFLQDDAEKLRRLIGGEGGPGHEGSAMNTYNRRPGICPGCSG
jgi:integrase